MEEPGIRTAVVDAVPPTAVADAADRLQALTAALRQEVSPGCAAVTVARADDDGGTFSATKPTTAPEVCLAADRAERLTAADLDAVIAWMQAHLGNGPLELAHRSTAAADLDRQDPKASRRARSRASRPLAQTGRAARPFAAHQQSRTTPMLVNVARYLGRGSLDGAG